MMQTLAMRLLMQAQIRTLARLPDDKLAEAARDFAHVRDHMDSYRNTSHLRKFFSGR